MGVTIVEMRSKREKKKYIKVPFLLHKNHKFWVPPLYMHEKRYTNPGKNTHFSYSDTICFVAYKDGIPVGRIMGIVNNRLNKIWKDPQARFCNFESINDKVVAHSLLHSVSDWARKKKLNRLVGPLGFSNQDPQGFLIEGFNERPSIGTIYNYEYIPELLESAGFTKEVDYVTYKVQIPETIPPLYEKISERVRQRASVRVLEFNSHREVKPFLPRILRFMNETYTEIYGFIPLSDETIRKTAHTYSEIIDPNFIKVIVNEKEEIVSFILGIKDITEGFQKARGRLIPIGYFLIKSTQKKSKRLDLLLGAIKKEYRGKGLDTVMAIAMIKSAQKLGMEYSDSHHELESNTAVQAEMQRLGGIIYKRHRVYKKRL
jgi:hypothetical protein